jgi:hypothetical protein
MKKYQFFFAVLIVIAGCTKPAHVQVKGSVNGLNDAVFLLTDVSGNTIAGDNIVNGSFKVDTILENNGYGTLSITKNGNASKNEFEIYLEPTLYTITANADKLSAYPQITSTSKVQKELSAYYEIYDKVSAGVRERLEKAEEALNSNKSNALSKDAYVRLIDEVRKAEQKQDQAKYTAFETFVKQNPQSAVAIHIMSNLDMETDPAAYMALYKKLSAESRNTDEGKEIGGKLEKLVKLIPGAKAPEIAGTTPDGKKFSTGGLKKKGYIIDFWRAGNQASRLNHQDMIGVLQQDKYAREFGIISISLDDKRDWWTKAITDDNMTWPQYSDLKGDKSVNAQNWMVTTIPSYYLVDANWNIIERNIQYTHLLFTINDYVRKH